MTTTVTRLMAKLRFQSTSTHEQSLIQCFIERRRYQGGAGVPPVRGEFLAEFLRQMQSLASSNTVLPAFLKLDGVTITGSCNLSDIHLVMTLIFSNCVFDFAPDFARSSFIRLDLRHSRSPGIDLSYLRLTNHLCLDDYECEGMMRASSMTIGGQWSMDRAAVFNATETAIFAHSTNVRLGIFLRQMNIRGRVLMTNTECEGQITTTGSTFSCGSGFSLMLQGAVVKSDLFLRDCTFLGEVGLAGVKVGGQLTLAGSSLIGHDGNALFLKKADVSDGLFLYNFAHTPLGLVDLSDARISELVIDRSTYPLAGLKTDNLRFGAFVNEMPEGREKPWSGFLTPPGPPHPYVRGIDLSSTLIRALMSSNGLRSQGQNYYAHSFPDDDFRDVVDFVQARFLNPVDRNTDAPDNAKTWKYLARYLEEHDRKDLGQNVMVEYERRKSKRMSWLSPRRYWRSIVSIVTGYGYKPGRALLCLILFWGVGSVAFWVADSDGNMVPSRERFYLDSRYEDIMSGALPWPAGYPQFSPSIYALDVMLPIVDFAQETHWRPGISDSSTKSENKVVNGWLIFNRLYLILGWALSTIGVLGFTGFIKRGIE